MLLDMHSSTVRGMEESEECTNAGIDDPAVNSWIHAFANSCSCL
jgi:hypothetical protein